MERNKLIHRINGGILLCGGGARTPQVDILAREVFELDILSNTEYDALESKRGMSQPEFVTAMGLVSYVARKVKAQSSNKRGLFGWFTGN